jgi:hypothetical protein
MQNINRRLIAGLIGGVVICLVVVALSSLLILRANLRGQGDALAAATATSPLAPIDTPVPTTPSGTPVTLVLDSASRGSMADQPGSFQFSASVSTSPLRPNIVANFTVSYCDQQYIGGTYLDPTGHATYHSGSILVKCSFPFTVTLTGVSLTQGPAGDEPLQGSVRITISS